jgi:hypothetical protein
VEDKETKIIEKLIERLESKTPFALGPAQRIEIMLSTTRNRQSTESVNRQAQVQAQINLSKSDKLRWWRKHIYAYGESATHSSMEPVLPDAFFFLGITLPGEALRDILFKTPLMATKVLADISKGASLLYQPGSFNKNLLIANPLGAFLEFRGDFKDRMVKKGSIYELTQKQEKILLRIGRTVDSALERSEINSGRKSMVSLFKTLWLAHLEELEYRDPGGDGVAPQHVTFMLLELLFQTCSMDKFRSSVMGGESMLAPLSEWMPMHRVFAKIARKGRTLNNVQVPVE